MQCSVKVCETLQTTLQELPIASQKVPTTCLSWSTPSMSTIFAINNYLQLLWVDLEQKLKRFKNFFFLEMIYKVSRLKSQSEVSLLPDLEKLLADPFSLFSQQVVDSFLPPLFLTLCTRPWSFLTEGIRTGGRELCQKEQSLFFLIFV